MEWIVIGFLIVINMGLTVWFGVKAAQLFHSAIADLDGNIAAALKSLIEQGIGDIEPINPVQQAIAHFITERMSNQTESGNPVLVELPRGEGGKFA